MKKIFYYFIVGILIATTLLLISCDKTKTEDLTKENYQDFINIEYEIKDCVAENNNLYCNIAITASGKNNASFSSAEIGFDFFCSGFTTYNSVNNSIIIPYLYAPNGKYKLKLDNTGCASIQIGFRASTSNTFPSTNDLTFRVMDIKGTVSY